MRKPRRVAGLQGAGGVPAETGDSAAVVMPEGSKRDLAWNNLGCWTILVWGEFGVKGRKFCMELGGPAALEVRDRYGEAWRVALWLEKGNGKRALLKH